MDIKVNDYFIEGGLLHALASNIPEEAEHPGATGNPFDKLMADWFNKNTDVKGHYLPAGVYDGECQMLRPSTLPEVSKSHADKAFAYLPGTSAPSGVERKKSFKRKVEAQRWLDQLQAEMHQGRYIDPSAGKTLVAVCAQRWCDGLVHLKPSTLERYRGIVNTHIVPVWGSWQVARITPNDVNRWIGTLVADGLRPSSVRQTHRVLSLILDAAVQDGRIGRNPAHGAKLPRPVRTEPMYLTPEQVGDLAEAEDATN